MERSHRQLRSRLSDRLGRNDSNCFAFVDQFSASEVATVAERADSVIGFAGQRGPDLDALHSGALDGFRSGLVNQSVPLDQNFAVAGMQDVLRRHPSQNALAD